MFLGSEAASLNTALVFFANGSNCEYRFPPILSYQKGYYKAKFDIFLKMYIPLKPAAGWESLRFM